ncbi:hypothetical protein DY000_02016788 [Brassica cretica]|uniref:Uncharacterized protein n=1 Tax=Brassica cretica TaxID=69181 RepID=A0ABQ7CXA1_BRACR|nr:hypothetical protein DY000_02016788 [Brassica cretica]
MCGRNGYHLTETDSLAKQSLVDALQENSDILREKIVGNKFPRKLRGPPVRRKAPQNIPRENFLGTYLGSSDEMFLRIFIGNFRGNEPSENSEEQVPRYIPRNVSLCIF